MVLVTAFVLAMAVPMAATGKDREDKAAKGAFVPVSLLEQAKSSPDTLYPVIVQGAKGKKGSDVALAVGDVSSKGKAKGKLGKAYKHVAAASAMLSGEQILALAERSSDVSAITPDVKLRAAGLEFTSREKWPYATGAPLEWITSTSTVKQAPTIAFIDSGIEAGRPEFGGRVIEQVTMTQLQPNSPGDGRGHGTFVASIAASSLKGRAGVSPGSKIVMVDVMDDYGMAMTSDVIGAVDYVIQNKDRLGIKVLNMSLHATTQASVMFDPLDRAVEQAWFAGITVVAAAGNYNTTPGQPSGVPYAPGNDPFIITVGAADIGSSALKTTDEFAAPWSAYGYTLDGFAKPELGAPGRYMNGAVPLTSTLYAERVDSRIGRDGYLQMSGTSFAAPVAAGAAALILANNPTYTPDQVKGALMLSAKAVPNAAPLSLGVGVVDVPKSIDIRNAPNPNAALNAFVTTDSVTGQRAFDAASWSSVASSDASWSSASWSSASWSSASWSSASWSSASWSSASWSSASWSSGAVADASWSSASWSSASWSSASVSVNADSDPTLPETELVASEDEIAAFELENGLAVSLLTDELYASEPAASDAPAAPTEPVGTAVETVSTTLGG